MTLAVTALGRHPTDPTPPRPSAPWVDIVVPVHNEQAVLVGSVTTLERYLREQFPFTWRITIADNASTDPT